MNENNLGNALEFIIANAIDALVAELSKSGMNEDQVLITARAIVSGNLHASLETIIDHLFASRMRLIDVRRN